MATREQLLQTLTSGKMKALMNESKPKGKKGPRGVGDPDPSSFSSDADYFDRMYLSEDDAPEASYEGGYNEDDAEKEMPDLTGDFIRAKAAQSRLPENIKESMINNPIDTSPLDTESIIPKGFAAKNKKKAATPVNEAYPTAPTVVNSGIDYSVIRAIVNECLETKLAVLMQKQTLNESNTLKTIGLKNGKINLVDNKGNVYSAELTYTKNINEKKK